jgi:hypothetical protein
MRRNFVSEILERLQYLFLIGLASILALIYELIATRPLAKKIAKALDVGVDDTIK